MKKFTPRTSKTILTIVVVTLTFIVFIQPTLASTLIPNENVQRGIGDDLQDELDALEDEIDQLEQEQNELQSQIEANQYTIAGYNAELSKIYGEVELLNKEIDQLDLEIRELEIQIEIIEVDIEEQKKSIADTEDNIDVLEFETDKRIEDSYMNFRLYGSSTSGSENLLSLDSINNYFKTSQYKSIIQQDTNKMLTELARLKQELKVKKAELDEKLVEVKKQKEEVDIKRADLAEKQEDAEVKAATYYSQITALQSLNSQTSSVIAVFEEEEVQKRAEAEKIRQEIFNNFNPIGSGTYVVSGTMIGRQGSTGWSTGPHLHFSVAVNGASQDPCGYLPGGVLPGCGWGSALDWPIGGEMYYTSGYGNRCFWWNGSQTCQFHDAIDVAGVPWNTPIYAAHDGYLFKGVDIYGALYIIICESSSCSSGIKTGYWHLSEY